MARKPRAKEPSPTPSEESVDADLEMPTEINPYQALGIERDATAEQVKSAYRKAALRHHPDKAPENEKEAAHKKFQDIAFAYAVLSDERRRKRYDTTGNTAESLNVDDDDFNWTDFFREQTAAFVNEEKIDEFKREYQGSEEEREDILAVYRDSKGSVDEIYSRVMCSDVVEDDERFRGIIDAAIESGEVEPYKKYTNESEASKKRRLQAADREGKEAMAYAEELGVKDKLFGKKNGKKGNDEDALKALIQQRQQGRSGSFLDNLEAKYGGGKSKSKRKVEEPPEELFARNAKKSKAKKF